MTRALRLAPLLCGSAVLLCALGCESDPVIDSGVADAGQDAMADVEADAQSDAQSDAEVDATDARVDAADGSLAPDDLSDLITPLLMSSSAPAIGAAVTRGDALIAIGAAGRRSVDSPLEVTTDDKWHLGSCTKAMTGTLIARLVEQDRITWVTTLGELFPETAEGAFGAVTLEQLVAHRGGFPEQVPSAHVAAILAEDGVRAQRRALVDRVTGDAALGTPGESFLYSNVGFMVAGAMLEEQLDATWETLLETHVFAPLAMDECGFGVADDGSVSHPQGHELIAGAVSAQNADNPPVLGPAGTVHCSLASWGKFTRAHATRDASFLSARSFDRMHQPTPTETYAAGWALTSRPWAGGLALTHSGSNTLNFAITWVAPATGYTYLVTANFAGADVPTELDALVGQLIERYR